MEKVRFSVVVPSYKTDEETMKRTIESVLSQKYKPFEIIIVDDNGGNEFTQINKKLAEKYHGKVKFVFYEKNMGANYARNTGIKNAKGDMIAFLDADDAWNEDYLERNAELAIRKGAKFISNSYYIVTQSGKYVFDRSDFKDGDVAKAILKRDFGGPTSSIVVDRDTLIKAGLFDEALPARQDYDMWIRCAQLVPFYYINEPLMSIYRDGHASISSSYVRNVKGTQMVLDKILLTYTLTDDERKDILFAQYSRMAMSSAHGDDFKNARKYTKLALKARLEKKAIFMYMVYSMPFVYNALRKIHHKQREKSGKN